MKVHYSKFFIRIDGKKAYIEPDNVFTVCPICGKEHRVDLQEIGLGTSSDLLSTSIYCNECNSRK